MVGCLSGQSVNFLVTAAGSLVDLSLFQWVNYDCLIIGHLFGVLVDGLVTELVVLGSLLVKWEAGLLVSSLYVGLFPLVLWSVGILGQLVSWSIGQFNNLVGRLVSW